MEPEDNKKNKEPKKEIDEDERIQPDDIPSEDVDMIREKNNPYADNQYNDDNSFGDDR
jgi:hypothetical protein